MFVVESEATEQTMTIVKGYVPAVLHTEKKPSFRVRAASAAVDDVSSPFSDMTQATFRFDATMPALPGDFDALSSEWNSLAERHRGPTHRVEWAQACVATCWRATDGPLKLFTVRRDGRLTALAVLRARHDLGVRYFEDLGTREQHEPSDWLYETDQDLDCLIDGIVRTGQPFVLCRLPGDSKVPERVRARLRGRGLVRLVQRENYPQLLLDQFPEGELNSGRRSDLRRMRRRAEQSGGVRVEVLSPKPDEVDRLLDRAIEIEAASWKMVSGYALKRNEEAQRFLRDYLRRAAHVNILRIAFLYIGDKPAAMQLGIECSGGLWLLKVGYDASLSSMAPGQLLMQDTIAASVRAGLKTYELMGTAADWTRMWTSNELPSWRLEVYPPGFRSAGLIARKAILRLWKRWR